MSSPQPSSTQGSNEPSIQSSPSDELPLSSYRDISGKNIFDEIQKLQSHGIHYAASENIASQCEFVYNKDVKGDILIPKNDDKLSEFILAGIFEIDARNFFMTSDGKWNSNNPLGTRLDQVKPTCQLLPVQRDKEFSFSQEHFPFIVANLREIENLTNPRRVSREFHSVIVGESTQNPAIKVTHHLFVECRLLFRNTFTHKLFLSKGKKNKETLSKKMTTVLEYPSTIIYISTHHHSLAFTIHDWPVSSANELYLDGIKDSYDVEQLPAYDIRGTIIHPSEYEEKLAGAIARVCFSIVHFSIKQKHIFNAIVKDITIVRPPTSITPTTLKHILHPRKKQKIQ